MKTSLRSQLFPALEEVLGCHLCRLKEFVKHHRKFHCNVLESSSIPVHTQRVRNEHQMSGLHTLKRWPIFRNKPKLDGEHWCVCEVWHTLYIQYLLDLGPSLYDRVYRFSMDTQLWGAQLRILRIVGVHYTWTSDKQRANSQSRASQS